MSSYHALAGTYDALTGDVGYEKRADFLEKLFQKSRIPVKTVLDLVEGASVAAQIVYFKATGGKLLLKTAPLHRHMEMCGKTHKKISLTLTVINILGAASAVAVMYYGGYILR